MNNQVLMAMLILAIPAICPGGVPQAGWTVVTPPSGVYAQTSNVYVSGSCNQSNYAIKVVEEQARL